MLFRRIYYHELANMRKIKTGNLYINCQNVGYKLFKRRNMTAHDFCFSLFFSDYFQSAPRVLAIKLLIPKDALLWLVFMIRRDFSILCAAAFSDNPSREHFMPLFIPLSCSNLAFPLQIFSSTSYLQFLS